MMRSFAILCLFLSSVAGYSSVNESSPQELLEQMNSNRQIVHKQDLKERELRSLLYATAKKLEKLKDQERDIEEEILQVKSRVSDRLSGLKIKKEVIQEEHRKILKRFRLISTWYKSGVGDLLFSSKNIRELDKRMFYLRKIVGRDANRLLSYSNDVKSFAKEKSHLKEKIKDMARMKKQLKNKQAQMGKLTSYHRKLLSKATKQKSLAISELTKIRSANKDLLKSIEMGPEEFFTLKGKLKLPVKGYIYQDFGIVPKERKRVSLYSNGIRIRVSDNKKVSNVASGEVEFVGNLRGYGMTVVINHGDRYYTVYSNIRVNGLNVGAKLKANEFIGRVGGYPQEKRNYLHFELRKFSEAIDPVPWIEKKYIKLAKTQSNEASM